MALKPPTSKQAFAAPSPQGTDRQDVMAVDSTILRQFIMQGIITPPQITATANNYEPAGFSGASVLRLTSDASRSITGLKASSSGRVVVLANVGSNDITLADESASSLAENRFAIAATGLSVYTIAPDDIVIVQYDRTSQRWRFWTNPYRDYAVARGLIEAKGDLLVGTSAGNLDNLTVGANDTILMADSGQTTGLKWVASGTPSTQAFGDAAAEGTTDGYARTDHKHGMPASPSSITTKYKASDETVNNSDVLQNDNDIALAVGASEIWAFYVQLFYSSATATPDFKFDWAIPSGATGFQEVHAFGAAGSAVAGEPAYITDLTIDTSLTTADTAMMIILEGVFRNSTNAGSLQFRWAQNTATVEDTTLITGSYGIFTKVSA